MFDYSKLTGHFTRVLNKASGSDPLIIGLVGAGGKTSTLFALAHFFKTKNLKVLVSTTTKIYPPETEQVDCVRLGCGTEPISIQNGECLLIGSKINTEGKMVGCKPVELNAVNKSVYDVLLYEADGAKGRSIKAPSANEPVLIQGSSHIIGVIGLDALGQCLNAQNVHRLQAFTEITGLEPGRLITVEAVGRLVEHEAGLFKGTGFETEKILLLTKMDTPLQADYARKIQVILEPWNGIVFSI